jgi:hypothetical protein
MLFDGKKRLIVMENGETELDLKVMNYKWKKWLVKNDNIKYVLAMRYVGGDKLTDNRKLGLTFVLTNGWKIKPFEANHTLKVIGNLYTDDQSNPFIKTDGDFNVMVQSEVSNIIDIVDAKVYNNITNVGTDTSNVAADDNSDNDDWTVSN